MLSPFIFPVSFNARSTWARGQAGWARCSTGRGHGRAPQDSACSGAGSGGSVPGLSLRSAAFGRFGAKAFSAFRCFLTPHTTLSPSVPAPDRPGTNSVSDNPGEILETN